MKYVMLVCLCLCLCVMCNLTDAAPRYQYIYNQAPVYNSVSGETATAQGVANLMARTGRVQHFGGNRGYEGCGAGPTPQAAYAACCFANSGMRTIDVGYAYANGMWYCCRRYG